MVWVWLGVVLVAVGLAYWQFVVAEGTYLGPRVVTLLYDWAAGAYERIKRFDPGDEQWFLGLPLAMALETVPSPFVLDVGTGTGRLPRALLFQPHFQGRVVGLDLSRRMLAEAARRISPYPGQVDLIWQDARRLPFVDDTFDAVTCLEVLEFTPDPRGVLREMVRVLRPGGVLLTSNRVGPDAPFLPGRAFRRPALESFLRTLPLEQVRIQRWQVDYDLVWAVKQGAPRGGGVRPLADVLRCPVCRHDGLSLYEGHYRCPDCGRAYPVAADMVIEMAGSDRK
jgi:SAM-dependent methyltransferase